MWVTLLQSQSYRLFKVYFKSANNNNNLEENEINPYHEVITYKVEMENKITLQMQQWSILSNIVNYVQYNRLPKIFMI